MAGLRLRLWSLHLGCLRVFCRRIIVRRDYNYAAGRTGAGMDRAITDAVNAALYCDDHCVGGDCA